MAEFLHLEPVLDAALATLRANLTTRIAEVNGEHSDFSIEDVPDENFHVGGFVAISYPMVEVAAPDWTLTDLSIAQKAGTFVPAVVVRLSALAAGDGPERLYRRMVRYGQALLLTLIQPDAFGAGVTIDPSSGIRGAYRFNPEEEEREEAFGTCLQVYGIDARP